MAETTALSSRVPVETHHYELSLGDYWRILIKRKFIVFITFLSVLTGAIIYTNMQTPLYQASSAVRVFKQAKAFDAQAAFLMPSAGDEIAISASNITNQEVMEKVVLRLGLLSPKAKAEDLSAMADEIRSAIQAEQVGITDVISIMVTYSDPVMAAAIANETAKTFVEVDAFEKSKQVRSVRQFIENQLNLFKQKLRQTEERIRDFRQTGRALGVAAGMEERLSQLQKEKGLLLKQYTEKHPDVVKLETQVTEIQDKIKKLPADELELARLQREMEISDRAYRTMVEKYEAARLAEAEEVGEVSVVATATPPKKPISPRKNLNKLLGALVGVVLGILLAFGMESIDTSIGTIEDVERTVGLPVIGIVPYYNPRREGAPWWRIDLPFLDAFKQGDNAPDSGSLIMNQDSLSTLSESYRILRTFIEFLMEKTSKPGTGKVLLITSTGPQEGKTLTSCNLAISLAQAGKKTLLIDTDLRRPVVHRLFGIDRHPGLSDVLLGSISLLEGRKTMGDILVGENSKWDKVVTTKMLDRLEILTTGAVTHSPAELLASDAMKGLISQARLQYEYIILDTPPVLPVTDARTLGTLVDASFFVYRAGKTARRALLRAREELRLAGVDVKGIILNHATPEVTLTDAYYYQYYGDKKGKK